MPPPQKDYKQKAVSTPVKSPEDLGYTSAHCDGVGVTLRILIPNNNTAPRGFLEITKMKRDWRDRVREERT